MTLFKLKKEALTLAQLALQFTPDDSDKIVGPIPTDEELSSLYENRLDSTRRAQILSHIANNASIHDRWIRCVETLSYVDELENKSTINSESLKNTKSGLIGFFTNLLNTKILLGGGLSTAAILVIVISIIPLQKDMNIQLSLNTAYDSWGNSLENEWASLPMSQKPKPQYSSDRSYFSKPKVKSSIQQVLETGFRISINQIGESPFKDYGIETNNLSSITKSDVAVSLTTDQYESVLQIGQIAALASLQCKLDAQSARLKQLNQSLVILQHKLTELKMDDAIKLYSVMNTKNNNAVCTTAQYVIGLIRN